jgi:hypothetical protein
MYDQDTPQQMICDAMNDVLHKFWVGEFSPQTRDDLIERVQTRWDKIMPYSVLFRYERTTGKFEQETLDGA